ncbi:hypothetical protein Hanom_Chr15g01407611 [Helianthus anomalus]
MKMCLLLLLLLLVIYFKDGITPLLLICSNHAVASGLNFPVHLILYICIYLVDSYKLEASDVWCFPAKSCQRKLF